MPGDATIVSLSLARLRGLANHDTERHTGVGGGILAAAGVDHLRGLVQQASDVDARQRRGHRPEGREHREATADRGIAKHNRPEPVALGHLLHV